MKAKWVITGLIPLVPLLLVLGWVFKNGAGVERDPAAPIEVLNIEQVTIKSSGFELDVSNTGPETLTTGLILLHITILV